MVETAGTKLRRARQLRQLSIEDASRATKIRVRQIADLEADEYSNFANLAYARSFLVAYGKYLHVDTRPYMDAFTDASTFGLDDYQYLSETPLGVYRSTRRMPRARKPKRQQIVAACVTAGLLAVLLFGRLVYNTYERLGDVEKIAARREARARGVTDDPAPAVPAAAVAAQPTPEAPVELPALTPPLPASVAAVPGPSVPLPGDGAAVRELLATPLVRKPAYDQASMVHSAPMFHPDEPQPQKVVNNDTGRPLN